ncbi:MAG: hypothetical protein HDT33_02685 [Clostridiales bacterium]|nr:hypothetical protein [Clostridiales bacterium]
MTADYLLGLLEIKNHSDAELDDLHLGDDIIELLSTKSKPLQSQMAKMLFDFKGIIKSRGKVNKQEQMEIPICSCLLHYAPLTTCWREPTSPVGGVIEQDKGRTNKAPPPMSLHT